MTPLHTGKRIAGYVIERELGRGGMGEVYLARDEALDRLVAVKVVAPALAGDERFRERFLRESRAAARLEHPAIVPVHQAGEEDGRLFLVMRYIAGGTLADRLAREPLPSDATARFVRDVAGALDAAHAAGLIHRDVKPGNVLLDGDRALLADFGLARTAMSQDSLSRDDAFSGTVGYIAPEQIEGDSLTGQADQYGLACVAFECLTGDVPFRRDSEVAAIYAHLSDAPPRASAVDSSLPRAVDAVLDRGLAKDPHQRFESCGAFAAALAAALVEPVAASSRRRRWVVAVAAAGLALVVAAAVVATRSSSGGAAPVSRPDALVALDAASGAVRDVVPLGQRPTALAVAPDGIWVALAGGYQVVRVDRATRQVTQRVAVGGVVNGLAAAGGSVWATLDSGRELLRIDPGSGQVSDRVEVANGPGAMAATDGSLWIASRLDGTVSRFDISAGKVTRTIPIGAGVTAVVAAFGSVWATSDDQASVTRIDAVTGEAIDTIPVGHSPAALAAAGRSLWIANRSDGTVSRLDPARNVVVDTVPVAGSPGALIASGEDVLVTDDETGDVYRVAGTPPSATRISGLHATASALGSQGGVVLVTTVGLPASHRGGVLRIATGAESLQMDPAIVDDNTTTWIWDTLVRFRRTGGSAGYDLVPDLAEAIPKPTDDGRTYVFHVRRGIRYSNGMEVRPSDFVRALDRIMRGTFKSLWQTEPLSGGWNDWVAALVGGQGCLDTPTSCDLSRAAVADDAAGTITYHLRQSDPTFIRQIARTPTAPVPPGTPTDGSWDRFVPGTGPYMMVSQVPEKVLIERRNPYFHVWSPDARPGGNPDEIRWLLGNVRAKQIALVESGQADGNFWELKTTDVDRLLRQYPSRLFLTPIAEPLPGFALDPRRFPLSSRDVRRAINFAIDRNAAVRAAPFPMVAACQTIRPGVAGYAPYCPYGAGELASGAPDVARARALVRRTGAAGAKVTVGLLGEFGGPEEVFSGRQAEQDVLLRALRAIGLRPVVKRISNEDEFVNDHSQIRWHDGRLLPRRAEAAAALAVVTGDCEPAAVARGAFCDAETRRLTVAANRERDPIQQARDWAALDRHLTDQAAWVPIGSGLNTVFLGRQVGNYAQQLELNASLWELLTVR